MKNKLTKNIGLKLISLIAAFFLWLVVVNVDDPVINKTYTNVPVEVLNADVITNEGKYFEVLGGTDTINVVVTAKRSVIDDMSRDYIKATADMKALTFLETVPIEVRAIRYADKIESVSSRTESLKLQLEDVVEHVVPLTVNVEGEPGDGFLLSSVKPKFDTVTVWGPESSVADVASASCNINVDDLNADESLYVPIVLHDADGVEIVDEKLTKDNNNVSVNVVIWATKEIPLSCGTSGTPAEGYSISGSAVIEPASVVITGRSAYLDSMSTIYIPAESVSVNGMSESLMTEIDISSLLPNGISFADENFNGLVNISVQIEPNDHKLIEIPVQNITVANVPDGYKATMVDIGGKFNVEIQGKGDTFDRFDGTLAIGAIDALSMTPRNADNIGEAVPVGDCDGRVIFNFPAGVTETRPVFIEVIMEKVTESAQ